MFKVQDRPVFCLCTLWRKHRQHLLPSPSRSVFSTLIYATGQKTMSCTHAQCKRSQSTSFVPGEHSWLSFASVSSTEHPKVSRVPTHATWGTTGWDWNGSRSLRNCHKTNTTSSTIGGWLSVIPKPHRQMTPRARIGATMKSQTDKVLWRSCWRYLWLKDLGLIW